MSQSGPDDKKGKRSHWSGCDIEEHYLGEDRKHGKEERKRLSAKDRSKYKKTDLVKQKNIEDAEREQILSRDNLLRGRVLSIQSQGMSVECEGKLYVCALRGVLKKGKSDQKNLVAVGDFVRFEVLEGNEGAIAYVEPRKSILSRADNLSQRKEQLIAANIDQVLITVSVVNPTLKPFLVDRYIIAASKGNMDQVIIVNKIDLIEGESDDPIVHEQRELFDQFCLAYEQANIPIIKISAETGEGLDALRQVMKDKVSVFSGQSGVGKSSLINRITGLDLAVGETVRQTRKGAHTTSMAQLVPLEFGGWCIDTPGIKSFGVWDLTKDEIEGYYTEIFERGRDCKYPDCSHTHELDCAVKLAVNNDEISPLRYESYISLLFAIEQEHKRR